MTAIRMRSVLFAPGNRADVLAKMPRSNPDVAVVDLEDAVPATGKAEARTIAREACAELVRVTGMAVFVRVNASVSEFFSEDVAGLASGLDGVVVPKLESAAQVEAVRSELDRAGVRAGICAGIETAAGVEHAVEILGAPGIIGGYFGAEDFIADMGGVRTAENAEVAYARSRVALAGRLGGVAVADQIVVDFADHHRFDREAAEARALGYSGKLCIHPAQVSLANAAFVPSAAEVARAEALLEAYGAAVARGDAAIAFDGQMVDEPVARQARAIIARQM